MAEGGDERLAPRLDRVDVDRVIDRQALGAGLADQEDGLPPTGRLRERDVVDRVPAPDEVALGVELLDLGVDDRGAAGAAEAAEVDRVAGDVTVDVGGPVLERVVLVGVDDGAPVGVDVPDEAAVEAVLLVGHLRVEPVAVAEGPRPQHRAAGRDLAPERPLRRAVPPARHAVLVEDDQPVVGREGDDEEAVGPGPQPLVVPLGKALRQTADSVVGLRVGAGDPDRKVVARLDWHRGAGGALERLPGDGGLVSAPGLQREVKPRIGAAGDIALLLGVEVRKQLGTAGRRHAELQQGGAVCLAVHPRERRPPREPRRRWRSQAGSRAES